MRRKQWCLSACDKDAAAQLAESGGLDPFLALLLTARGLTDEAEAEAFLSAEIQDFDPFSLADMEKAVERIAAAMENFERVAVFGDYDADGVTSTALLYSYLVSQGANVEYRIPDRMREGYGISCAAVRELAESGVRLIVTVDNGIAALQEVALAKELGVDVVITDHHTPGEQLPDAVAVVNPHRKDCPSEFKAFAGVGVAFQLVCALEGDCDAVLHSYADLLAIGTLADVVPLIGENRAFVKKGIRRINAGARPGIEALKAVAGVADRPLTASNVAFTLAPRINAAGRIGSAETALQLLLCDNEQDAIELANETDILNKQRQAIETKISAEAIRQIEENPTVKYASVLVVSGEGWHPGVIGIVAARLTSQYGKPAVVITTDGDTGKGSCRSIPGFSVYDALQSCETILTHFGGHPGAAGLGIATENIPALRDALDAYAKTAGLPFAQMHLDCKLNPAYINLTLLNSLSALEPCGCNNPVPTFGLYKLTLCAVKPVGEGKHLRLTFKKGATELSAMLFSTTLGEFPYRIGDTVDLAVQIEKNVFRGEIKPSVHIKEMRFSDTDEENYLKSMRLYEKYRHGDALNEKEISFLTPSRAFLLGVYKFMKTAGKFPFDMEVFCKRSGCPYKNAATAAVSFDVLTELCLLEKDENGAYLYAESTQKADLSASNILKTLSEKGA